MAGLVDEHSASELPPHSGSGSASTSAGSVVEAIGQSAVRDRQTATRVHDEPSSCAGFGAHAPDWSLVHFYVDCARCGHDLRGRSEPVCPACGLEFEWSKAVPLEELTCSNCGYHLYGLSENRCPECGESFTWEAALADYHLRCKPWFEYQWTKTPVRSFVRTVSYAVRPWRLWREMSIHDPPRVSSLLVLWLASATLMIGVPVVQATLFTWIIGMISTPTRWITFFDPVRPAFGIQFVALAMVFLFTWNGAVFLTLLTLRWSMARCQVRWRHVFRVCVYLLPLFCWMPALMFTFMFLYDLNMLYDVLTYQVASSLLSLVHFALVAIALAGTGASLGLAYRRYIRMPHA